MRKCDRVLGPLEMIQSPPAYFSTFNHALSSQWRVYSGVKFRTPNESVAGGSLWLNIAKADGRWQGAGVALERNFTYGSVFVRFRMQRSSGTKFCILLWPQTNAKPPEIDFAEDSPTDGAKRNMLSATLHVGRDLKHWIAVNLTQWNTVGVVWRYHFLEYILNGKVWAKISGPLIPSVPMHLAIQDNPETPDAQTTPVSLQVDWVYES